MKQVLLAIFLIAVPVAGFSAFEYFVNTGTAVAAASGLGDLSAMQFVVKDTIALADKGDLNAAASRITDFETLWDEAEPSLRPMNKDAWSNVDSAADSSLKALRTKSPDAVKVKAALQALSNALADPSKPVE